MKMNVYDAIPMLKEVLVSKYFSREVVGRSACWFDYKCNVFVKYKVKDGMNSKDVAILNAGFQQIANELSSLVIDKVDDMQDESFQNIVSDNLNKLRTFINLPYFASKYLSMSIHTFRRKIGHTAMTEERNFVFFSEDIDEINNGIQDLHEIFSKLEVTL